jgi:hypothetical protein
MTIKRITFSGRRPVTVTITAALEACSVKEDEPKNGVIMVEYQPTTWLCETYGVWELIRKLSGEEVPSEEIACSIADAVSDDVSARWVRVTVKMGGPFDHRCVSEVGLREYRGGKER